MGVINIKNVKVSGNGQLLNNATIATPNAICIDDLSVEEHAKVLHNLNILDFCTTAEARAYDMSPEEYESFRKLLQKKDAGRDTFFKQLCQHLSNFAVGVAANVVSDCISTRL